MTGKLIKIILVYLVVVNSLALLLFMADFIYSRTGPSVKSYKSFVIEEMEGDVRRYNNFKTTEDYKKMMNATSVDSVRFYYTKYTHTE